MSTGLILAALDFAARQHRQQRRKDAAATPYINHPIALANLLANPGGVDDPLVLVGALLHDTVEDTETSLADLEARFGPEVAALVSEVTDDKSLPKAERKQRQIDHAAHLSERARLVKLADKICNLRDLIDSPPPDWSGDRRRAYLDWSKAVVDGLRGSHPQLEAIFDATYQEGLAALAATPEPSLVQGR